MCDQKVDEICRREEVSMKRRETLKLFGAAAVAAAIGVVGISGLSFAQDQKKMVTVVKIAGIPWFNALENGVKKAGRDFSIDASVVGPAHLDEAQQVKLLEDLIAQKVVSYPHRQSHPC
jgi:simple sugar transport system substrate-binding protein